MEAEYTATKSTIKEMKHVYEKPIFQYTIEEAVASDIDDVLITTGRNNHSIEIISTSPMIQNMLIKSR